jgi:hypothetical protein
MDLGHHMQWSNRTEEAARARALLDAHDIDLEILETSAPAMSLEWALQRAEYDSEHVILAETELRIGKGRGRPSGVVGGQPPCKLGVPFQLSLETAHAFLWAVRTPGDRCKAMTLSEHLSRTGQPDRH